MLRRITSQAVCSLAFLLFVSLVNASSFAITPLRVTLSAGSPTGSILVHNESLDATLVQLEVAQWSQHQGIDVLQPTIDILVTPPIVSVPPGGSQIVRLGLRRPVDPEYELTYRLNLRELPPPPKDSFQGLQMVLNLSLPVFVLPIDEVVPILVWSATYDRQGAVHVSVSNPGKVHVKIVSFSLEMADGTPLGANKVSGYVLAGESREWPVEVSVPMGSVLNLVAQTDAGEFSTQIQIEHPDRNLE